MGNGVLDIIPLCVFVGGGEQGSGWGLTAGRAHTPIAGWGITASCLAGIYHHDAPLPAIPTAPRPPCFLAAAARHRRLPSPPALPRPPPSPPALLRPRRAPHHLPLRHPVSGLAANFQCSFTCLYLVSNMYTRGMLVGSRQPARSAGAERHLEAARRGSACTGWSASKRGHLEMYGCAETGLLLGWDEGCLRLLRS